MAEVRRQRAAAGGGVLRGRVRAHDPFELIRWLAFSQPDPRKALAELVQNALDARARHVRITRVRERGVPCVRIFDDGEGVIPEMDRPEALRYIATHIGHSRKRSLSPEQRLQLMTQGQYGIGLLGFWSLGERLEMRSAVPGQRPHRLILYRDRPEFVVEPLRGRLPVLERWTEVIVVGLHDSVRPVLSGRRIADYLANELRGQLLARGVELLVEDRMSRGRAQKLIPVRPARFLGTRLEGFERLEVPGYPPMRVEIYMADPADGRGEGPGSRLAVYAAGSLVASSFEELAGLGLDRPPWTDPRLQGVIDFPPLTVSPGSRHGIVLDEAAEAFRRALESVEKRLAAKLAEQERRRREALERGLVRELRRAFRDLLRSKPRYEMLPVRRPAEGAPGGAADAEAATQGSGAGAGEAAASERDKGSAAGVPTPPAGLLPPGPLDHVKLQPSRVEVVCGGRRRVRAIALDATGRPAEGPFHFEWKLEGPVGRLEAGDASEEAVLEAAERPGKGSLGVHVRGEGREAHAEAPVEIVEEIESGRSAEGIPSPLLVDDPHGNWRSRLLDGRWQVNAAHRDYREVAERPALKLRYLALLFSKEIVLRSSGDPRLERPLEQVVEVFAFADRRLSRSGRKGAGSA